MIRLRNFPNRFWGVGRIIGGGFYIDLGKWQIRIGARR